MPTISVIIPAYNCENFLEKSAQSVLCQSYTDLELIIVNDGSTDGTEDICRRLSQRDERVHVLNKPNGGVSSARNLGINEAKGEYIAFVDADDWLEQDAYALMMAEIEKSGAQCAMCSHYRTYPEGFREVDHAPFATGAYDHRAVMNKLVRPLLEDRLKAELVLGTVWRYLFKRSRIIDMNIMFTGAYLEDEIFLIEYFAEATTLACVDVPLYNYLQNPASVTHRYLANYVDTFAASLRAKQRLVERYHIAAPENWVHNSTWAGLLIAVSNEFAPGNSKSLMQKTRAVKSICKSPCFASAIKNYKPSAMNRNKTIVAKLLRGRMYFPLALLYTYKNRNRR